MVNWCAFFPPRHCPPRHTMAVETVLHQLPDLREHFIYAKHNDLLMYRSSPDDFFDETAKPRFWVRGYGEEMYKYRPATGLRKEDVPRRISGVDASPATH